MRIIGITGGVGAGKTLVLHLLKEEFGVYIIMADEVGQRLMEPDENCYNQIIAEFGAEVVKEDDTLDRAKLAQIIFHNKKDRLKLETIIHPAVKQAITKEIFYTDANLVAIEAALLIEDNYKDICDQLWYIYAPEELRIERLADGRRYSVSKSKSIIKNQLSDAEYRHHCDVIIDNGKTVKETRKQLEVLLRN